MEYELPDGTRWSLPTAPPAPTPPRRSAPAWPAPRWRSRSTASCATWRGRCPTATARPTLEMITERSGDEALELIRHDAAHVLAAAVIGALPGGQDLDRAADRERLLLRLRLPRRGRRSARPTSRAIEAAMREHIDADEPFVREDVAGRRRARALRARGAALQGRADRGPRPRPQARDDRVALHQRAVHRSLPRARTRRPPSGSRRSSSSQSPAPTGAATRAADAHARLRHRVLLQAGSGRVPRAPRAGARQRPPAARAASSACSPSPSRARVGRSGYPAGTEVLNALVALSRRDGDARAATRRSRRRSCSTARCGRPRATGTSTATTCSSPSPRTGRWRSSR